MVVGCHARPEARRVEAARLSVVLPDDWRSVPPSSDMRALQAVVAGPGGDAELVIYYFGPGRGGDIESNLQRWMNQVIPAPGTAPRREAFEIAPLRVTWIDAEGTIKAGEMGMGPVRDQPGSRLLAAVIEGERGPWFVKLSGPEATVTPQRDAFRKMLHSAMPR